MTQTTEQLVYFCAEKLKLKKAPLLIITNHKDPIACTLNIPFFPVMIISHGFNTIPNDEKEAILYHEYGHLEHDEPYTTGLIASFVPCWFINHETHILTYPGAEFILYIAWAILILSLFYAKRQSEYRADAFSLIHSPTPQALIKAIQREEKQTPRKPNKYSLIRYLETHPSGYERIEALKSVKTPKIKTSLILND